MHRIGQIKKTDVCDKNEPGSMRKEGKENCQKAAARSPMMV